MKSHFQFPVRNETSLHLAIHYKRAAIVRLLLEHGANVDQRGDLTPLREAIMLEQPELVALLLAKGADPSLDLPLRDAEDCAAKTAACRAIVDLLKNAGTETYFGPNPPNPNTPYYTLEGSRSTADGPLAPLDICNMQIEKRQDGTLWTINGQQAAASFGDNFWPVFYVRYSNAVGPDARGRMLLMALSEKVGRREFYQRTVNGGIALTGKQVSQTVYRFEAGAVPNGQYAITLEGSPAGTGYCFRYERLGH